MLISIFVGPNLAAQSAETADSELSGEQESFSVALTGKYPPFSFYDNAGELAGFDVDVSREIANRTNYGLNLIATEWDGILPGLLGGRYDAIIGSMAITAEREKAVDFSRPYYISGAQLFVREGDAEALPDIDALAGKRVGCVLGTTFEQHLEANYPEVEVVTYKSDVDVFQELENGQLDGFVTDRLVGMFQIKQAGKKFVPAGALLYDEQMGIPVAPGDAELLAEINAALEAMEQDGTFAKLHEKWFGSALGAQTAIAGGMQQSVIWAKLFRGFLVTLWVAFSSLLIGFLVSVPVGALLHRASGLVSWIARFIVDFLRGTPVLIQLFFVYFGSGYLAKTKGWGEAWALDPIDAAVLTLSINAAAYMAEVIRSGLMAVDPGQAEAARALGLGQWATFRHVIWPQAFRIAMPPLMNSAVALLKDTALVSVISVAEVVHEAQSIIAVTYDPMRYYFIVGLMFFLFTFPLMKLAARFEKRMKERGFGHA